MRFLFSKRAIETLEAAITFPIAILVMLATVNLGMVVYGQQAVQAAARHGARMGSVAQQCGACYAASSASSAIDSDPIVKEPSVAILSPGGVAGSILSVRVSGTIPSFLGNLVPGLPGSFPVSAEATFRQEGW
ncbi:MAG: TadE family protein [Chloroflexota bacterium]